ncbi:hypothetical protein [Nocardioides massiliensis]|uniref:Uncharacterized protein n=1 Tax=Nocardioides massiliensis TaxID=1325935 RepID=A0ABT9NKW7_9ACTN|nr:hypothetical protein [Nocardioides massiliensis]MDP9821043.1 hypothetical protein [Nocardioides massiliensis]
MTTSDPALRRYRRILKRAHAIAEKNAGRKVRNENYWIEPGDGDPHRLRIRYALPNSPQTLTATEPLEVSEDDLDALYHFTAAPWRHRTL